MKRWTEEEMATKMNKIHNLDCLEFMKQVPDNYFDLVLTDPPYGIGANKMTLGNGKRKVFRGDNDWDKMPPNKEIFIELERVSKHQIIWGANHLIEQIGRNSSKWIFWDKGTGDNDFADGELAYTSFSGAMRKIFISWVGANAKENHEKDRYHPTQKPVELFKTILQDYAVKNNYTKIFDAFGGSGTTGIACKSLGLDRCMTELEPDYCEIANKRLQAVQTSMFAFIDEVKA